MYYTIRMAGLAIARLFCIMQCKYQTRSLDDALNARCTCIQRMDAPTKIFSPVLSVSLNFKFRLRRALPKTCTALILICSVGRYASINTNKYVLVGTGIITS